MEQVTLDVRAPENGVVQALLVVDGEVVVPGQMLATVIAAPHVALPPKPAASLPFPAHVAARTPGIHFPARRTASGERISDLPADRQEEELLRAHAPASHAPAAHPSPRPAAGKAAPSPVAPAIMAIPAASKAATTVLVEAPPGKPLTAREVELINSGGAF